MRVGMWYDAHRLVEGDHLILGGVEIPFEKKLLAHSDGDVLLHAIADSLLGAAGLGDIGVHFPDNDPAYRGISSLVLLERVREKLTEAGLAVQNVDSTIVVQQPKLVSFIPQMRKNIAAALRLDLAMVNVKATTTEGMGFTGSGEGIAAYAVCLLVGKWR